MRPFLTLLFWLLATNAWAHGGEDHSHGDEPAATPQSVAPRAVAASDAFEAVAYFESGKLVVFLNDFSSNRPLVDAKLEVDGNGLSGQAKAVDSGRYELPVERMPEDARSFTLSIETEDNADLLSLTGVTSGQSGVAAQKLADGSLFVPKQVQHMLGIRTERAEIGNLSKALELNGKVIADPDASGVVQAAQAGVVLPAQGGMPMLGRQVTQGETLAWLKPSNSALDRGNQQAALAEIEAELAMLEREVRRLEQVAGTTAKKDIENARIERDALKRRLAFVSASLNANEPLLAPVSGIISASHVAAGQVVDVRDTLFEIVDPKRMFIEAMAYDMAILNSVSGASARIDQQGSSTELEFVGAGRQLKEHALPLLFRILDAASPVAVGQQVRVMVRTQQRQQGIKVPRAALIRSGSIGQSVLVQAGAERFVARQVAYSDLDGASVVVTQGLKAGERVVIEGATLLGQIR